MGFAMYCMPSVDPLVRVYAYYGERRSEVDPRQAQMGDLRREIARFVIFRGVWGELLVPRQIGETAANTLTRADNIQVVVTEGYLDRETWRLAARKTVYDYPTTLGANLRESHPLRKPRDRSLRRTQKRKARAAPGRLD